MQLFHIGDNAKLRELWPEIAAALRDLRGKCDEKWYTADIWHALLTRAAMIYVAVRDDSRAYYLITELGYEPFNPKPYLNVWMIMQLDNEPMTADECAYLMSELHTLAHAGGASRIRMVTPRKGWERHSLSKHMTPIRTVWETDV